MMTRVGISNVMMASKKIMNCDNTTKTCFEVRMMKDVRKISLTTNGGHVTGTDFAGELSPKFKRIY
jgi:hypothetical protein